MKLKTKAKWLAVNKLVRTSSKWKSALNGDDQIQSLAGDMWDTLNRLLDALGMEQVEDVATLQASVFPCPYNWWMGTFTGIPSKLWADTGGGSLVQSVEDLLSSAYADQVATTPFGALADAVLKKLGYDPASVKAKHDAVRGIPFANSFRCQAELLRARTQVVIQSRKMVLDMTNQNLPGNPGGIEALAPGSFN